MESIKLLLKTIKRRLCRFKLLPRKFWFNKNIGYYTSIDRRIVSIVGEDYVKIGNCTKIMAGLRLEAISDYGGVTYNPEIVIGDYVCINQNFHCTCASRIEIGNGTSITANCGVFDIEHPYDDITINPRKQNIISKPVKIGKDCMIGMNSIILPGVILGNHTVIGSNSTVCEGVYPGYCVLAGTPAKIIKRYDFKQSRWRKTNPIGEFID